MSCSGAVSIQEEVNDSASVHIPNLSTDFCAEEISARRQKPNSANASQASGERRLSITAAHGRSVARDGCARTVWFETIDPMLPSIRHTQSARQLARASRGNWLRIIDRKVPQ